MKRLLALLCVIACLAALCIPAMAAEETMIPVIAQVPDDWTSVALYAWDMEGTPVQAWPGAPMQKLEDGWFYGYITLDQVNIIVNNNNNGLQTVDLEVDYGNYEDGLWVVVGSDATDGKHSAEIKYSKQNTSEVPDYADAFYTLHVSVPSEWHSANVWAWDDNNTNAFGAWPGEAMTKGSDGWYTVQVPSFAKNFLIVEKDGGAQTVDYKGNGKEQWVVLGEADSEGKLAVTVTDSAPEGYVPPEEAEKPVVDNVTVHAAVPEAWEDVRIWAWDDSQNNVYEAWPGEAMTKGEDGWYTLEVPGWFTGILVNSGGGSSQTGDIVVEAGKDLWINAMDPLAPTVSYEAIDLPEAPKVEDPAPTEPAATDPVDVTEPDSEEPEEKNDSSMGIGLIIGIVVAGVAVVAGVVIIVFVLVSSKKKKVA